jgi:hypothetical protein
VCMCATMQVPPPLDEIRSAMSSAAGRCEGRSDRT